MDNDDLFLNNLASNPNYDLLKTFCDYDIDGNFDFSSESPYENANFSCDYIDPVAYSSKFKNIKDITLMSLNIQSLPSKFNDFKELISFFNKNNCAPDIICLQELWQFPSLAGFSLPGYSPLIYKLRSNNVQGGGVGI